jgi:hypothetical protein
MDILTTLIEQRGLSSLLDIPGVREPLARWCTDEIRQRYQAAQAPAP